MTSPYDKIADKFIKSTDAAPKKNFTDSFRPTPQPVAPPPMPPQPVPTPMPQEDPKVGFLEGALAMALGQLEKQQVPTASAFRTPPPKPWEPGFPTGPVGPISDLFDASSEFLRQGAGPGLNPALKYGGPFSLPAPWVDKLFPKEVGPEAAALLRGETSVSEAFPLEALQRGFSPRTIEEQNALRLGTEAPPDPGTLLPAFEKRGPLDQLLTGVAFDPLNLLPAPVGVAPRLGTLGKGIGKMVGQLMDVYRIADQADKVQILRQVGQMFKGGVLAPGQMLT